MDFFGPFVPFVSYFWVIKDENDLECGMVKSFELSMIYYLGLFVASIG